MKVLGIGFGRTGTMSLAHALERLGYRTKHLPSFDLDASGTVRVDWTEFDSHEALTDESVTLVYREADRRYPGSKFILTVRDLEGWLRSRENFSDTMREAWTAYPAVAPLHRALFGTPTFERQRYAEVFQQHIASVTEYFADRMGDLLVMDVCGGDGWEKLCPFLHKAIPEDPFPRSNALR